MRLNKLKTIVGIFMICAHFGAMMYVLALGAQYFSFDQALDIVLILAPLFSAFTLAIVTDFVKHRSQRAAGPRVNSAFVFVTLFFPIIYTVAIFGLITAWPMGWIAKIEQLRRGVAACETLIGAALGIAMGALFEMPKGSEHKSSPSRDEV
jgi:hypothetical protein